MNVTMISTMRNGNWPGSELLWYEAARYLARRRHSISASVHGWPERPIALRSLVDAGVQVHEHSFSKLHLVKPVRSTLQPLLRRASLFALSTWLRRVAPDFICISNGEIGDQTGIMNICRRSGRPYAVIVQANAEQWWPHDDAARQLIEVYQNAQRVFFVSRRNRLLLETQLGIDLPNAEVVRNPFNLSAEAALPWPETSEPLRLACVGRLEPDSKGQDLLLQVLSQEPWRSRPLVVSLFGRGYCEEGLRRLAASLSLNGQVRFCGHVPDVKSIWATHHALILPSRYEGLPLAVVEAMLCGRPVIVTDVAGNTEVVEDGATGFIAEAPTVQHLQSAMERAWQKRDEWRAMGEHAGSEIRRRIPSDPGEEFGRRLETLAGSGAIGAAPSRSHTV
jgi:glycosyltransferase involved in cell wall biosynthesis